MDVPSSETTQFLRAWAGGDQAALEQLTPRVYRTHTSKPPLWSTKPTLKLVDINNVDWQHRAHFCAVSAQIMRRILLDLTSPF